MLALKVRLTFYSLKNLSCKKNANVHIHTPRPILITRIPSGICRASSQQCASSQNAGDIKNVLPEKVGQSSPKSLKTCYPLRAPIMPNFIEIGHSAWKKALQKFGLG